MIRGKAKADWTAESVFRGFKRNRTASACREAILDRHRKACIQQFECLRVDRWVVLVTGFESNVERWHIAVRRQTTAQIFDAKGFTWRVGLLFDHGADGNECIEAAIASAIECDVTLQLLCSFDPIERSARTHNVARARVTIRNFHEEYPLVYLATHGMKWGEPHTVAPGGAA